MPKLSDHGLGGGSKAIGVPIYPLNTVDTLKKDYTNGTWGQYYGDTTATAPVNLQGHASSVYGDEIYFIGHNSSASECYKYNVKTRVWTKLKDAPTTDNKSWAVTIGTDIWYGANGYIFRYNIGNHISLPTLNLCSTLFF